MSNLANFRTKLLALLDDPSKTKYTDAQIDQSIRQALTEYNRLAPFESSAAVAATGEKQIPLDTLNALFITAVHFPGTAGDPSLKDSIPFNAFQKENIWILETRDLIPAAQTLTVFFAAPNTVTDLDSATETTIPDADVDIFSIGAAGFAALARAHSRTESINLAPEVSQQLQKLGESYLTMFKKYFLNLPGGFVTAQWKLDTDSAF